MRTVQAETGRQIDRDRQIDMYAHRYSRRCYTDRHNIYIYIYIYTDTYTERQTDMQTDTNIQ